MMSEQLFILLQNRVYQLIFQKKSRLYGNKFKKILQKFFTIYLKLKALTFRFNPSSNIRDKKSCFLFFGYFSQLS